MNCFEKTRKIESLATTIDSRLTSLSLTQLDHFVWTLIDIVSLDQLKPKSNHQFTTETDLSLHKFISKLFPTLINPITLSVCQIKPVNPPITHSSQSRTSRPIHSQINDQKKRPLFLLNPSFYLYASPITRQ